MRRYDDPVEVRKGMIGDPRAGVEGPAQFLWHGRLWVVREVVAHWVETGPWWSSAGARAVIGSEEAEPGPTEAEPGPTDLLPEREFWRVEAGQARGTGVFDLSFDWAEGCWQLVGCLD